MKITREELTRLLAEIVKKIDPYFEPHTFAWNPLEDANQALQLLEALGNVSHWNIHRNKSPLFYAEGEQGTYHCVIYLHHGVKRTASRTSDNLNHAVCLAVAEAVTGNKYELED